MLIPIFVFYVAKPFFHLYHIALSQLWPFFYFTHIHICSLWLFVSLYWRRVSWATTGIQSLRPLLLLHHRPPSTHLFIYFFIFYLFPDCSFIGQPLAGSEATFYELRSTVDRVMRFLAPDYFIVSNMAISGYSNNSCAVRVQSVYTRRSFVSVKILFRFSSYIWASGFESCLHGLALTIDGNYY